MVALVFNWRRATQHRLQYYPASLHQTSPVHPLCCAQDAGGWGVKLEALKMAVALVLNWRRATQQHLPAVLEAAWTLLTGCLPLYVRGIVRGEEDIDDGEVGACRLCAPSQKHPSRLCCRLLQTASIKSSHAVMKSRHVSGQLRMPGCRCTAFRSKACLQRSELERSSPEL